MSEYHFMEDENELPYLVWEVRDRPSSGQGRKKPKENRKSIDDILMSMDLSQDFQRVLKDKVISFLNARDCTDLTVIDHAFGTYSFVFTRENRYVRTTHEFEFIKELENPKRVFRECYTTHNHDRLLVDSRFQQLIKGTGFEFEGCSGGYEIRYSMADDEFTMLDEINVNVSFRDGQGYRMYFLDLERMELSKDYLTYSGEL